MSYTEIKERNGKKYYYRVISIRIGKDFSKKRKYLGEGLDKDELLKKEQEADKKLSDNYKNKFERTARKNILKKSTVLTGKQKIIKGYDFNKGINYEEIIKSYSCTGFQAAHLSKAIEITNNMIKEKAFIYLGYTSNMISSGLREIVRWLTEHKKINVLVTTTGGIEEDIIKCLGNFVIGDFRASGTELRKKGINRIGNIFVENNHYIKFEQFIQPIINELYQQQLNGETITPGKIVWKIGEKINNPESIYYWAWKNKIPVYCPSITDGALGDNIYFSLFKNSGLKIDIVEDMKEFNDTSIGLKKSGAIILGAGMIKHVILNANLLRNGLDYAVYINTAQEFDGSDAGALPEEAISWGKILPNAESIKVFADATIIFPLLVSQTFAIK